MSRFVLPLLLLWPCAGPLPAQPVMPPAESVPISLPPALSVKPGRLLILQAQSAGKDLQWYCGSPDADLLPYLDGRAIFSSPTPGRYTVLCWTALDGRPTPAAVCVITVGLPDPPKPPEPPAPENPLVRLLLPAWQKEAAADRDKHRKNLAALYRQAADFPFQQKELKTLADLQAVLQKAAKLLLPDAALPSLRQAVATHLLATLGNKDAPLDAQLRLRCEQTFEALASALEALP